MPSTSSKNNNICFPKILLFSRIGLMIISRLILFRRSLALSSIKSRSSNLANDFTNEVFPVPGGPTIRRGFVPLIQFFNQFITRSRDFSFPKKLSNSLTRYFSTHIISYNPYHQTKNYFLFNSL